MKALFFMHKNCCISMDCASEAMYCAIDTFLFSELFMFAEEIGNSVRR